MAELDLPYAGTAAQPLRLWLDELSAALRPISEDPRRLAYELTAWAACTQVSALRLADRDSEITSEMMLKVRSAAERLPAGEPLAYVMGGTWFYGSWFTVRPETLIPRPDSEILVEQALDHLPPAGSLITESGIGSGAVLISVLQAARQRGLEYRGAGYDLSPAALACAGENRSRFDLEAQLGLYEADLLPETLRSGDQQCGLLLANLPYIRSEWIASLDESVRLHEPLQALDGGTDGLELIRRLIVLAGPAVCDGGWIMLEHDADQGAAVRNLLEDQGTWQDIYTAKDYAGRPRVSCARMGNES